MNLKHDWSSLEKHNWCSNNKDQSEKDFVVLEALDRFNQQLYDDLETRRRALKNWNKLRIIFVVFKLFTGKVMINDLKSKRTSQYEIDTKYIKSLDEWFVQYIFLPTSPYLIPWSTFTCILYVASFYNDCLTLATGLYTLLIPWRKIMQTVASFVMFIDSMIFFITAYRKESNQSLDKKKANKEAANKLTQFKK